jgi:hypothetical protein
VHPPAMPVACAFEGSEAARAEAASLPLRWL